MIQNQWTYLIAETIRGIRFAKVNSLASVFTISICTAVLGAVILCFLGLLSISEYKKDAKYIRAYLSSSYESEDDINRIRIHLTRIHGIDSIIFLSKEAALLEFKDEFGTEMLESLPYNPLPPSFIIYPGGYYSTAGQLQLLRKKLEVLKGVETISSIPAYLSWLDKWKAWVLWSCILVFVFIGTSLSLVISNAVKMNLYARKGLVENMKYCGASEFFLTLPFLLEGWILGGIGGALGIGAVIISFIFFNTLFPILPQVPYGMVSMSVIGFMSLLSSWASYATVRQFIHQGSSVH
jgi:cell division transport system permease protein